MRTARRLGSAVTVVAIAFLATVPTARGQGFVFESTPSFRVDVRIEPSGDLLVTETIVQEFGSTERHGILRYIPDRLRYDDRYDRITPIELLEVT
ncbi:MAG TPA: DUF2207 domain-containing protein, partial [Actinomycetota bacterium]|nr:DUF2207 domain-containing protein [Actinomycetota bacterium]